MPVMRKTLIVAGVMSPSCEAEGAKDAVLDLEPTELPGH